MVDQNSDHALGEILKSTNTIAMVGVSSNPVKASYFVARYLKYRRFRVIPVNPVYAGQEILGMPVYASLAEIPKDISVDMVDIFRRAEFVPDLLDEALEHLKPGFKTLWMQLGITHDQAAQKARDNGITVVEDRCPKMEYQRLSGELRKAGINTGIITSKKELWTNE
ncbi:MAG: CoA-binding protein [Pseudomonadota bacterium]